MNQGTENTEAATDTRSRDERIVDAVEETAGTLMDYLEDQRRWARMRRAGLVLLVFALVAAWLVTYLPILGFRPGPVGAGVAVVPIEGSIGQPSGALAEDVVPNILTACRAGTTKVLVLRIASGGGSPSHAERMADALKACRSREEGAVPVVAVIEGIGASAAYLVASQADQVIANRYAQVGSIGAVWTSLDLTEAAERFGVAERAFASGGLKTAGSPMQASTPEQDQFLQAMVEEVAAQFRADVRAGRGARLKDTKDLYSGRTWLASEALERGLIDEVATFEGWLEANHPDQPVHTYRPARSLQDKLGLQAALESAVESAVEKVVAEATTQEGQFR